MKEKILKKIKKSLNNPIKGRNSMGCSESYYDEYFMVGECFTEKELKGMSEKMLVNLIKLAEFASEVFY